MADLVLSLFPGLGLLDMAFEAEGFCVVRGPDRLWGGDVRRFHPSAGRFQGIIGGPPCQAFSSLVHLVRANGCEPRFGNLIPEYERCVVEAQPDWFLMENVPAAPEPIVSGYGIKSFLLDNSMLDSGDGWGEEQRRVRRFSFGLRGREPVNLMRFIDLAVFVLPDAERTITQAHVNNSDEAKGRTTSRTVTALGPAHLEKLRRTTNTHKRAKRQKAVFGDGRPTRQEQRVRTGTAAVGHGEPPSVRDGKRSQNQSRRYRLAEACRLQGLPEDFLADAPFTAEGKLKAVANGVPLSMGRAIARAVIEATKGAERVSA